MGADKTEASCCRHQRVDRMGNGLTVAATTEDGAIAAVEPPSARGWFVTVQWHPKTPRAVPPKPSTLVGRRSGGRSLTHNYSSSDNPLCETAVTKPGAWLPPAAARRGEVLGRMTEFA